MKSRWDDKLVSQKFPTPLLQRVYSSRLLGQEPSLVLHGGGNTSVKVEELNLFQEPEAVLYVKGSGWDLKTIEPAGFSPVRLEPLKRLVLLTALSDKEMVREMNSLLKDPAAPSPSVEAILHAIIPFRFVDHTHADAVVTICSSRGGAENIRKLYGDEVLVLPYVMPGFVLSRQVYQETMDLDWSRLKAIILLGHGVFTFSDSARQAYENMLEVVSVAEDFLNEKTRAFQVPFPAMTETPDPLVIATIRSLLSGLLGRPPVLSLDKGPEALAFSRHPRLLQITERGPVTPDHVIHTKRVPMILGDNPQASLQAYEKEYRAYFEKHRQDEVMLDPAPRWIVWPGRGVLAVGLSCKRAGVVRDISRHTMQAILNGEALGGWESLPAGDIFAVEYWELEQAKLRKSQKEPEFTGRTALVTGAASGIGLATVKSLLARGACVLALDLRPLPEDLQKESSLLSLACDVTDSRAVRNCLARGIEAFGGLDLVVSNAGSFPESLSIRDTPDYHWDQTLSLNLSSHFKVLRESIPYLEKGFQPAVVMVGSKNVPAPGAGVSAYSCSKAGLTQLARVAALELAPKGIRVQTVHPNGVMDTGIWTEEVIEKRAKAYGISTQQYRKNNLLDVEVTSPDVAMVICQLASGDFSKSTGLQVPVDGGNSRVL